MRILLKATCSDAALACGGTTTRGDQGVRIARSEGFQYYKAATSHDRVSAAIDDDIGGTQYVGCVFYKLTALEHSAVSL